jgi:hypothetical protein
MIDVGYFVGGGFPFRRLPQLLATGFGSRRKNVTDTTIR